MIHLKSSDLDDKQNYKLISGSIIPRAIAWISTFDENKKINLAPFSFFTGAAKKYPLVSVSILRKDNGDLKDTAKNLIAQQEGVINLVSVELLEKMNATAATLDSDISEVDVNNISMTKSSSVAVAGVSAAKARFEVKLYDQHPIIVGQETVSDIFVLEITDFHYAEDVLNRENLHINYDNLNPVGRLSGPNYTEIGKQHSLIRPK